MTQEQAIRPHESEREGTSLLVGRNTLTIAELRNFRAIVTTLLNVELQEGTDYGLIPGTQKPGLWKPGAEKVCALFRLAREISCEERTLGGGDYLYHARVRLVHGPSGVFVGEGAGVASSLEEKYAWRRAVCDSEFAAMEEAGRAKRKWKRGKEGPYEVKVVRQDSESVRQTIYSMAVKRAFVDATRSSLAVSDVFEAPEAAMAKADREEPAQATAYESVPDGSGDLPFPLDSIPIHPSGNPVFTARLAGKTWKEVGEVDQQFVQKGQAKHSPLTQIVTNEAFHPRLREMAERVIQAGALSRDPQVDEPGVEE